MVSMSLIYELSVLGDVPKFQGVPQTGSTPSRSVVDATRRSTRVANGKDGILHSILDGIQDSILYSLAT